MNNTFFSLCYHYVKNFSSKNPFNRILGTSEDDFYLHIEHLAKNYEFITLDDVYDLLYRQKNFKTDKTGLLITFDDGLSDHYTASKILSEFGIQGVFFIPTCIVDENLPANPTIIHYAIAKFGIQKFLNVYNQFINEYMPNSSDYQIKFDGKKKSIKKTMFEIKNKFKYDLNYIDSRKILLHIFDVLLLKNSSNIMDIMHLKKSQIIKMKQSGHAFGTHTHTHISVSPTQLTDQQKKLELIDPKTILEKTINDSVTSFSYPFGGEVDCFSSENTIDPLKKYDLIFTVEEKLNHIHTSPYSIGRYQPVSTDNYSSIQSKLIQLEKQIST
jgi:peptidoglycan/xylan/chitin deacetylase (PgdA/CDA1 family)